MLHPLPFPVFLLWKVFQFLFQFIMWKSILRNVSKAFLPRPIKKFSIYLFFFALLFPCFSSDAKNSVNLIEKSSVLGFSLYWEQGLFVFIGDVRRRIYPEDCRSGQTSGGQQDKG